MSVYFIQCACGCRRVKIGVAKDVNRRLADLRAFSAHPLELLGTIEGDYVVERWLHACFSESFVHSEWFDGAINNDIRAIIRARTIEAIRAVLKKSKNITIDLPEMPTRYECARCDRIFTSKNHQCPHCKRLVRP